MDKNKLVMAILKGIGSFVVVLLVCSLIRSLVRSETTFADAIKMPYLWYLSAVAAICAAFTSYRRKEKK